MAFQNDEMNGGGNWLLTFPLALFLSHERRGGGRLAPLTFPLVPFLSHERRGRGNVGWLVSKNVGSSSHGGYAGTIRAQ